MSVRVGAELPGMSIRRMLVLSMATSVLMAGVAILQVVEARRGVVVGRYQAPSASPDTSGGAA